MTDVSHTPERKDYIPDPPGQPYNGRIATPADKPPLRNPRLIVMPALAGIQKYLIFMGSVKRGAGAPLAGMRPWNRS